jgi:hypothetical protein
MMTGDVCKRCEAKDAAPQTLAQRIDAAIATKRQAKRALAEKVRVAARQWIDALSTAVQDYEDAAIRRLDDEVYSRLVGEAISADATRAVDDAAAEILALVDDPSRLRLAIEQLPEIGPLATRVTMPAAPPVAAVAPAAAQSPMRIFTGSAVAPSPVASSPMRITLDAVAAPVVPVSPPAAVQQPMAPASRPRVEIISRFPTLRSACVDRPLLIVSHPFARDRVTWIEREVGEIVAGSVHELAGPKRESLLSRIRNRSFAAVITVDGQTAPSLSSSIRAACNDRQVCYVAARGAGGNAMTYAFTMAERWFIEKNGGSRA